MARPAKVAAFPVRIIAAAVSFFQRTLREGPLRTVKVCDEPKGERRRACMEPNDTRARSNSAALISQERRQPAINPHKGGSFYVSKQLKPFFTVRINEESRTIGFFDAIPKYPFRTTMRVNGTVPDRLYCPFSFDGISWSVEILPARVQDLKGQWHNVYPGPREELVERSLRYLAVQQIAKTRLVPGLHDKMEITFSLSMIRRHLEQVKHGCNLAEIRAAIDILCNAKIGLTKQINMSLDERANASYFTILERTANGNGPLWFSVTFDLYVSNEIMLMAVSWFTAAEIRRYRTNRGCLMGAGITNNKALVYPGSGATGSNFRSTNRPSVRLPSSSILINNPGGPETDS